MHGWIRQKGSVREREGEEQVDECLITTMTNKRQKEVHIILSEELTTVCLMFNAPVHLMTL